MHTEAIRCASCSPSKQRCLRPPPSCRTKKPLSPTQQSDDAPALPLSPPHPARLLSVCHPSASLLIAMALSRIRSRVIWSAACRPVVLNCSSSARSSTLRSTMYFFTTAVMGNGRCSFYPPTHHLFVDEPVVMYLKNFSCGFQAH